jgi:glycosyltransferase involved in cell wall biosynthesis
LFKKIKVALVAPDFPLQEGTVNGGTAGVSCYLATGLRDSEQVDIDVVRPFAPAGCAESFPFDGIQVHALSKAFWLPKYFYLYFAIRAQVRRKLHELQPDVVHVQDHAVIAGAVRQPCVFTLHGIVERDTLFRGSALTRRLRSGILSSTHGAARRRLSNVIAISPYARQHLVSNGHQRIWEIPNPVPHSFFEVVRRPEPLRIFSASQMHPLKNIKGLLCAFAELARKNAAAQLRLAGSSQDGSYGNECRSLARELGIKDQVKFLGLLNIDQIRNELSLASIFTLCSMQENAPLSIAEAMAVGVPVMASAVGANPWMVTEGITGRLVNPQDNHSICATLSRMLFSDDLTQMGLMAKQKAETTYRASIVVDQTIQVYRELCNRK